MKRPSVWYMLPVMDLGGAEKHVIGLALGLKRRGYEVGIISVFRRGILSEQINKEGLNFHCLEIQGGWGPLVFFKIFRWLSAQHVDILHTYLFGFDVFAALPARILKVPVILSSRREIPPKQKIRHNLIKKLGNLFVDRVICCSKAVQQKTLEKEGVKREKTFTIYNGVNLEHFQPHLNDSNIRDEFGIPAEAEVVGMIANFSPDKGYPYLLDGAEIILKERPDVWFLLVGFGPLQNEMKKKAQNSSHPEHIIFTGMRHDIPQILQAMDVFVCASLREGFPNVLLEAMAMSRPIVATAVGGIPELIESGKNGILISPESGKDIAQAVLSLLSDKAKARKFAAEAYEKIRRDFDLKRMIDQYEDFYLKAWNEKAIGNTQIGSIQRVETHV